ncbi:MAG: flavodoxin domain-containing protein [Thermomicrobiales bacterium]|nr:flavodoxin domain-containing protein [Thermomicrobiales bacterium]
MSVAIIVASRHGSTREIAEEMARCLRHHGIGSTLYEAGEPVTLRGRTGVIVGSAVYMGRWLKEARTFVDEHQEELRQRPVWLFSSGPVGVNATNQTIDEVMLTELVTHSGALGHQTFLGKLDPSQLSRSERLLTRIVHAPEGDFRDFDAIDAWTEEIARTLLSDRITE